MYGGPRTVWSKLKMFEHVWGAGPCTWGGTQACIGGGDLHRDSPMDKQTDMIANITYQHNTGGNYFIEHEKAWHGMVTMISHLLID